MGWGFSLRASSPGRSGGGAGKGRRACKYVSEFEFHLQFPCGSQSTGAVRILPISANRKRARMYYFIEEEEKHLRIDTLLLRHRKYCILELLKPKQHVPENFKSIYLNPKSCNCTNVYFNRAVSVIS